MMMSELHHQILSQPDNKHAPSVAIDIAIPILPLTLPALKTDDAIAAKTIEVLQVDEEAIEAELEEIKRNAERMNKMSTQNKPALLFDPIEDTPTLTHQHDSVKQTNKKEVHETVAPTLSTSLNDKLKQAQIELTDSLQDTAIKDLKKAIGVNDRFLFINELFRGDEVMYERSIKTINSFNIFPEAEYWIKRELKLKLGWNDTNAVVKQFDQLVRRRFSAM